MQEALVKKAQDLYYENKTRRWTAEDIGRAIWVAGVFAVDKQQGEGKEKKIQESASGGKRKNSPTHDNLQESGSSGSGTSGRGSIKKKKKI